MQRIHAIGLVSVLNGERPMPDGLRRATPNTGLAMSCVASISHHRECPLAFKQIDSDAPRRFTGFKSMSP
ncbi:hypothetical protein [Hydrogenophaga sp.]|jgi:hypothetical protein|uniref:hypothetical protein n=1 Tax=Hydrogenophaga sp. TaxID=1904254 RepID=UPI00391A08A9